MPTAILRRTGHKKTVRHYEIENIHVEPADEPEKASGKVTFFLRRPEETLTLSFSALEIAKTLMMLRDLREATAIETSESRNNASGLKAYAQHLGYAYNVSRARMGWRIVITITSTGEMVHRAGNLPSEDKALLAVERWLDDKKMSVTEALRRL